MILKKDNLLIRDATLEDAPILCRWWNDGSIMAHAGFPNGLGITEDVVAAQLASGKNHILILDVDGIPVGEMNYRTVLDNTAEIGIKICDPAQQNKGFGTRFLQMMMDALFMDLGYQTIILDTNLKNTRAQAVYEKIGFRRVAEHIDSWKDQLGEWQSSVDFQLTKEDYHKRLRTR